MAECNQSFDFYWNKTKDVLLQMSKLYKQIKDNPNDSGLQNQYAMRIVTLDKNTDCLFNTLTFLGDLEQIGKLNNLYNDFNGTFYANMDEGKFLCRDIVEKIFTVANFHVVQLDGDQESWKSLKARYEQLLSLIPKQ